MSFRINRRTSRCILYTRPSATSQETKDEPYTNSSTITFRNIPSVPSPSSSEAVFNIPFTIASPIPPSPSIAIARNTEYAFGDNCSTLIFHVVHVDLCDSRIGASSSVFFIMSCKSSLLFAVLNKSRYFANEHLNRAINEPAWTSASGKPPSPYPPSSLHSSLSAQYSTRSSFSSSLIFAITSSSFFSLVPTN